LSFAGAAIPRQQELRACSRAAAFGQPLAEPRFGGPGGFMVSPPFQEKWHGADRGISSNSSPDGQIFGDVG